MKLWSLVWTLNIVKGPGQAVCGRKGQGERRAPARSGRTWPELSVCLRATSRPRLAGLRNTRQQVGLWFVFMNKFHFARATTTTTKKPHQKKSQQHPRLHRVKLLSFQPMCLITPPKAMLWTRRLGTLFAHFFFSLCHISSCLIIKFSNC